MDCGATCLRMIAKYYGKNYSLETLRERTHITREGVSLLGISQAAEKIGFRTLGAKLSFEKLLESPLPCIVHWQQNHFVVVYEVGKLGVGGLKEGESLEFGVRGLEGQDNPKIPNPKRKTPNSKRGYVKVADPGQGLIKYTVEEFLAGWLSTKKEGEEEGVALLFETTPEFYNIDDEKPDK